VFEGEAVGLMLAAKLIATKDDLTFPISILIDNQAAIQSGESFNSRPGSYLTDLFCNRMKDIAREHRDFKVTLCWVPGHCDIHGNEEVDKQAKKASEGRHNNSLANHLPSLLQHGALPLSTLALIAAHRETTHARWGRLWRKLPRYNRINNINPKILKRSFIKFTAEFPKRLTGLYMALCSQHIPLNHHLNRIGKTPSPHCPHCPATVETVPHLLVDCPQYQRECHTLSCALGRKASSLPYLLSNPRAIPHLVRFINAMGRLRQTFGVVPLPNKPPD
jgi:hypothetical protein